MSEAPTTTISQERPMEASVISMAQEVDKSCVCPVCSQRFAWPITMVDHVIESHGPLVVTSNDVATHQVECDKGIFWIRSYHTGEYGGKPFYEERLHRSADRTFLYFLIRDRGVAMVDGRAVIGGGC